MKTFVSAPISGERHPQEQAPAYKHRHTATCRDPSMQILAISFKQQNAIKRTESTQQNQHRTYHTHHTQRTGERMMMIIIMQGQILGLLQQLIK